MHPHNESLLDLKMALLSQYMWLHSHSQNASRNSNANGIQYNKRMKLNTLHLLETTEQELNIMSEVEMTRRVFYEDPSSEPRTFPIQKTFISELTTKEAFNFTRFRIYQLPTLLRHWRLKGVTFKLQYQKGMCCGKSGNDHFPYKDRQGNHLH